MLNNARVMSLSPGRVRLKISQLKNSDALANNLRERLTALPGIEKVDINQTTASLLMMYDQQLFAADDNVEALRQSLAEQLTAQEVNSLRTLLQSEETVAALRQGLSEALAPAELDRLHNMLKALAS